ncbi:hypothetical protein PVK06_024743 [Gossypium arboreum]|uniref:Uncharacterized protein n=1 Tax=Gossypium arboreum TaxID=29729 RepID=A0ABR0PEM1_GOSAR|nr:hypothetical protein PVK06_024743 [Gossypium arboreum]
MRIDQSVSVDQFTDIEVYESPKRFDEKFIEGMSFKDMLVETMKSLGRDVQGSVEDDFGTKYDLPSIRFSKRAHQVLYNSMAMMGHFVWMAIILDLNKPLISKIKVDLRIQRVEYKSLPNVCFSCGWYGHLKDMYNVGSGQEGQNDEGVKPFEDRRESYFENKDVENKNFGPWMLVDHQSKRNGQKQREMARNKIVTGKLKKG